MTFTLTIRTADRSPRQNYLLKTIENMERAGVLRSTLLAKLIINPTDSAPHSQAREIGSRFGLFVCPAHAKLSPNENAGRSLRAATTIEADYVIFLEDDLDFTADWLESVDLWLRQHQRNNRRVYPLCAAYKEVWSAEHESWDYPISAFYGTQAYALRYSDAVSVADFMSENTLDGRSKQGHDMLLKRWAAEHHPDIAHFLTPCPSMVQHIGRESSLHMGRFHDYMSFPGHDWSYYGIKTGSFPVGSQKNRPKYVNLAEHLTRLLPKDRPVYDFGCSTGELLKQMGRRGYEVLGFDGTLGIEQIAVSNVHHADLTVPMEPLHRTGSCISLEVAEHIPKEHEATFLRNVTQSCDELLFLSWAVPGQGGVGHINERDWRYVTQTVQALGFRYDRDETLHIREVASRDRPWLGKSLYVFRKRH